MSTINFNEERHEYTVNGVIKRYFSQMIVAVGIRLLFMSAKVEAGMLRGKDVHLCCHMIVRGYEIIFDSLEEECHGYVRQYQKFHDKYIDSCILSEEPQYHELLDFCCTPDQLVKLKDGRWALIEIKTGEMPEWAGLQLVANYQAIGQDVDVLIGLELRPDGYSIFTTTVGSDDYDDLLYYWLAVCSGSFRLEDWKADRNKRHMTKLDIPQDLQSLDDETAERIIELMDKRKELELAVVEYDYCKDEIKRIVGNRIGKYKAGNYYVNTTTSSTTKYNYPQEVKDKYATEGTKTSTKLRELDKL